MITVHVGRLIRVYTEALTCVTTKIYTIQTGRERYGYCQRSTTYDVRAQTKKEKISAEPLTLESLRRYPLYSFVFLSSK